MSNQTRIKEYLVGKEKDGEHVKGYLEKDISNGKVIMLSGKWGSGKTHFWQNKIASDEFKLELKKENKACHYVSLYGKKSIEEIENELFLKVYSSVGGIDEKVSKIYTNISFIAKKITKTTKNISEIVDKFKSDYEKNHVEDFLLNGGIICFDDFERKSKDIDLNDLFGFITQLTLNFNCKVVIILNDDVFEGEEKNIFSNVKEKSVSKFLYYNPSIEELFELIYDKHPLKEKELNLKKTILTCIEEIEVLNARIYSQLLDNLLEWIDSNNACASNYIRFFVFCNVNFILNHYTFTSSFKSSFNGKKEINLRVKSKIELIRGISAISTYLNNIEQLKIDLYGKEKELDFVKENESLVKSEIIMDIMFTPNIIKSINEAEPKIFNKIANFIETGILIDE